MTGEGVRVLVYRARRRDEKPIGEHRFLRVPAAGEFVILDDCVMLVKHVIHSTFDGACDAGILCEETQELSATLRRAIIRNREKTGTLG